MQLTLAFVEALPAQPTLLSDRIDAEARIEAVRPIFYVRLDGAFHQWGRIPPR